jgi:hypothetical protein
MNKIEIVHVQKSNMNINHIEKPHGPFNTFVIPLNPNTNHALAFQKALALRVKNSFEE